MSEVWSVGGYMRLGGVLGVACDESRPTVPGEAAPLLHLEGPMPLPAADHSGQGPRSEPKSKGVGL